MNKKGFTLIEVISTIVILSLIALIVFPAITSTIKSSRESAYKSQENILIKAAKAYYLDNIDKLPDEIDGNYDSVDIYDLVKKGYIAEEELTDVSELDAEDQSYFNTNGINKVIINPKNKKPLKGSVVVTYKAEKNQYIYKFNPST